MKKRTKGVLAAALAAAGVFLLAGLDARLLVRAYTVESGRLTGPVRLAVLTDLHACAYGEGQRELLDAVAEQSPDLVLLCGDIVDDEPRTRWRPWRRYGPPIMSPAITSSGRGGWTR